ncbi:S49 family peptidase [Natronolimnohabitans sp. A-GB9]|uniref:S49 family peptidase n=1 Tax=Natronolimnohabitans sp. A-GB9 TaxID=3069757 RepID=UPI0027B83611|nr:S49 family peptidase [Natronolimnohabitans sp. A-GB9]MDQ2051116.1 S49 family peptidase [Natronolimnohabitans sp. A-GB9]
MTVRLWKRLTRRQQVAAVALVAIAAGALAAPQVYAYADDSDGTIAVVEVDGGIDSDSAQEFEEQLREVRQNESIDGVVLDVDSPGGRPASSERMYTAVERTTAEMPVIAAVDSMGASGGYYTVLPADEIYVTSSSAVGSVGVAGGEPMPSGPDEGDSAPDKGGPHPDDQRANAQLIQQTFVESVFEQRGDRLELTREEVAHARTYYGTEAVDNGMADGIGTVDDAIHDVATDAGLDSYDVVTYNATTSSGLGFGLDEHGSNTSANVNPYQPQLIAPEVWHDAVGDSSDWPNAQPAADGGEGQ